MADQQKETVVVTDNGGRSYGWLIALGIVVLLVILFFAFGGMNLFGGEMNSQTINVDTPDTNVQVEP